MASFIFSDAFAWRLYRIRTFFVLCSSCAVLLTVTTCLLHPSASSASFGVPLEVQCPVPNMTNWTKWRAITWSPGSRWGGLTSRGCAPASAIGFLARVRSVIWWQSCAVLVSWSALGFGATWTLLKLSSDTTSRTPTNPTSPMLPTWVCNPPRYRRFLHFPWFFK